MTRSISLSVNGEMYQLNVPAQQTLLDVLRGNLGLTGTKEGCGAGECGACTVLMDGKPVNSCLVLAVDAVGKQITTIEGVGGLTSLDPIQDALIEKGAVQCGYCTPGVVLSAKALLDSNPHPTETEIREGLTGNLCRCTGYAKIVEAILAVSRN